MSQLSCPTCGKVYKLQSRFAAHVVLCKAKDTPKLPYDMKTKPFLKWVGGKTQILDRVLSLFPDEMQNYHEPFLGGGSVLLGLLSSNRKINGNIYASDLNENLIFLYQNIQSHVESLIENLRDIALEFTSASKGMLVNRKPTCIEDAMTSGESYYYWIRHKFNNQCKEERKSPSSSAMLLFLNKTCFRGVYREGPNGFNVPFGNYKNPLIFDEKHLCHISVLIKNVIFSVSSFKDSLAKVQAGDFVYLDPPYAPEKETSFVNYTANGFDIAEHRYLFKMCKDLPSKFVMSNSDVKLIRDSFVPASNYNIKVIECRRTINSKNPEAKANEVLISN